MPAFGTIPPEPAPVHDLTVCAPAFQAAVAKVLETMADMGMPCRVDETLRSPERSDWLYGMGRDYDDGRGVVTNAPGGHSWHSFGLAADIVHATMNWNAPESFWSSLAAAGESAGLASGYRWHNPDKPHLQWGPMPVSPNTQDRQLLSDGGPEAVWAKYHATMAPAAD